MNDLQMTRPYKMADEIFIIMEKLGLDPIKDVRSHYALEKVLENAKEAGYLEGLKIASVRAHEYGRRTYGTGGNKIRDVLHELGKELDKNVEY